MGLGHATMSLPRILDQFNHGPQLVQKKASAKAVDFRAFLRALRGFEDAEADLLDQAGLMVSRGYIGVGWVAATKPDEMEKLEQQEFQLFFGVSFW